MIQYDVNIEKLLLASIEDYCGLWEMVWEINTLYPHLSSKASQRVAYRCILYLISKDFVKLFYCQEPYGKMIEIASGDSQVDLLQDLKIWEPPLPEACSVRVSATKAGEKYYNDMIVLKKYQSN
ncbi:MAG: hypothetical protein AAF400_00390 [Bacteroidota bacterium]